MKNFCEDLFFFFLESTCACVLGPWPWPRAFLSLASRVSVLGKAVLGLGLGLGFFLCPWPWPWPRALCPRLLDLRSKLKTFYRLHLRLAERCFGNLQSARGPAQCKSGPAITWLVGVTINYTIFQ